MSIDEGGRSRIARHELLKMVPNTDSAAPLVWVCFELPCILRGSAPPRRSIGTCAAGANTIDPLADIVVSAGEALHSDTAVGEVVSSSWRRDRLADAAGDPAVAAADIATAAAVAMGAPVVDGIVGVVAALDASVADNPAAIVATLAIVVALGGASAVAAPATGSTSSPDSATARMSND